MKTKLGELLEKMEEHRNTRGMVGLGKDDDVLGTPNFEPETAIAPGTEEITDEAEGIDDKADKATRDEDLFGDTPVKHAEAGAAVKEGITTKNQYYVVLEALLHNLCELSMKQYVPKQLQGTVQFDVMCNGLYESILSDSLPVFCENISEDSAYYMIRMATDLQEAMVTLVNNPSKKNAALISEHYVNTCRKLTGIA